MDPTPDFIAAIERRVRWGQPAELAAISEGVNREIFREWERRGRAEPYGGFGELVACIVRAEGIESIERHSRQEAVSESISKGLKKSAGKESVGPDPATLDTRQLQAIFTSLADQVNEALGRHWRAMAQYQAGARAGIEWSRGVPPGRIARLIQCIEPDNDGISWAIARAEAVSPIGNDKGFPDDFAEQVIQPIAEVVGPNWGEYWNDERTDTLAGFIDGALGITGNSIFDEWDSESAD